MLFSVLDSALDTKLPAYDNELWGKHFEIWRTIYNANSRKFRRDWTIFSIDVSILYWLALDARISSTIVYLLVLIQLRRVFLVLDWFNVAKCSLAGLRVITMRESAIYYFILVSPGRNLGGPCQVTTLWQLAQFRLFAFRHFFDFGPSFKVCSKRVCYKN